jgi:hypothetical protein
MEESQIKQKLSVCPEYVRMGDRCSYIIKLEQAILEGNESSRDAMESHQVNFCGSTNYDRCPIYEFTREQNRNKDPKIMHQLLLDAERREIENGL